MSNIFKSVLYDQPPPETVDVYPTIRNNRTIRRIANAPTIEQRNKWESAGNIRGEIVGVTLLPFSRLGAKQKCLSNYNGYVSNMHISGLRKCGCFGHWRPTIICQLQALVLLVSILLQNGHL